MSARAAARLEMLGFRQVFRYTAGKEDWLANGWPSEGSQAPSKKIAAYARTDVSLCLPLERVGDVLKRMKMAGWDVAVVVNDDRVVLGLLRDDEAGSDPGAVVESVMQAAPRTYRLNADPGKAANYMDRYETDLVLVTTTDGELVGLVWREDLV